MVLDANARIRERHKIAWSSWLKFCKIKNKKKQSKWLGRILSVGWEDSYQLHLLGMLSHDFGQWSSCELVWTELDEAITTQLGLGEGGDDFNWI